MARLLAEYQRPFYFLTVFMASLALDSFTDYTLEFLLLEFVVRRDHSLRANPAEGRFRAK